MFIKIKENSAKTLFFKDEQKKIEDQIDFHY